MKRLLLISIFLYTLTFQAQFNEDAPWMESIKTKKAKSQTPITFKDIVTAFDTYWETRDPNVRGSGYKPFKRWENHWRNYVKEDGTLPTAAEIWNTTLEAKQAKSSLADLSNWISLGPSDFANRSTSYLNIGRVNAIIVDPNNPNIYYAGAPAGGIWKSTDSGLTWIPLGDKLPQIGVSGIAIDYNNSNIIYIATGDDDGGDTSSVGVLKSIDGGLTWNSTGLNALISPSSMNDIYISPSDSNTLWVGTNNGVYKTNDGGATWTNANNTAGLNIKDIKIKPDNPNTIYAVTTTSFYLSNNGGFSFALTGFGLPASSSRLVLEVTPANPNAVFVLSADNSNEFQGLYKSVNSGSSFTSLSTKASIGNIFGSTQTWYDMALAVSNTNENEIYTGVLDINKSTNGGSSFSKINTWYIRDASYTHADIHLLRFFNGTLFAGTDGGFFKSTDQGNSFSDLTTGMEISQFYRISVSKKTSGKIAGGLQDNGGFGYANNQWINYHGGDGMDAAIDPNNDNLYYGFMQRGETLFISSDSGQGSNISVSAPESGAWVTPLAINSESEVYAGYNSLYTLCGTKWESISPSFDSSAKVLEIDDNNPDIIFVAFGNILWKSIDRGITFSEIGSFASNITSVEINHNNSDIIYITTSGINGKVLRSNDGGLTFPDDLTRLLPRVTKNIIKHQDLHSQNPLYLGTSIGVYRYDDSAGNWELFDNNLPNVPIADLEINLVDGNITAGTYGRGVWRSVVPIETVSNEIALESIEGLTPSCGNIPGLQAKVNNIGSSPVNSINVAYVLNDVSNNFNWTGTLAPGTSKLIDIPVLTPTTGFQKLKVILTSANDTYTSNNKATKYFSSNSSGTINNMNDFEDVSDALLVIDGLGNLCGNSGYWERGIATGLLLNSSGDNVYGTNLAGEYAPDTKSFLISPCYDLSQTSNPVLKFDMAYDLEENWDVFYIEYSTDGTNWSVLGTSNDPNWYNSDRTLATSGGTDCYNCPGAQWTGTNSAVQQYSHELASLGNPTNITFRFVFHSDQAVEQEGIIIDNLIVEGATLSNKSFNKTDIAIYPNPSKNIFNLKIKNISALDFNITDITGKIVLQKRNVDIQGNIYQIDMTAFTSGIYFLNISSNGGRLTKKLILN